MQQSYMLVIMVTVLCVSFNLYRVSTFAYYFIQASYAIFYNIKIEKQLLVKKKQLMITTKNYIRRKYGK